MRFRIATCALSAALLTSCGTRSAAGGNSTEADNALQGTVVDSSGHPRAGVVVVAMPSRSTDGAEAITTVTDGSGMWSLNSGGKDEWRVEILGSGNGSSQEMTTGQTLPGAVLRPLGSIAGVVRTNPGTVAVVALRGTPRRFLPGPDGNWRFDSLPVGAPAQVCAFSGRDTVDLAPIQLVAGGQVTAPSPLELADTWAAESVQVAAVLAKLRTGPARVRRSTIFDSHGIPVGLSLDSLGLDSLPSNLSFPSWMAALDLSDNNLKGVPVAVRSLSGLRKLWLSGNRGFDTSNWSGLTGLTRLAISRANLNIVPDFTSLTSLTSLELDGNVLTSLPPTIWRLGSLDTLSVRRNRIDTLPVVSSPSPLRSLQLGGNRIRTLPTGWRNLSNLVSVGLDGNPFSVLSDSLGYGWTRLRWLDLDSTGISTLPLTLAEIPPDSLVLSVRGNSMCTAMESRVEDWLDRKFGAPWRQNQPQICH